LKNEPKYKDHLQDKNLYNKFSIEFANDMKELESLGNQINKMEETGKESEMLDQLTIQYENILSVMIKGYEFTPVFKNTRKSLCASQIKEMEKIHDMSKAMRRYEYGFFVKGKPEKKVKKNEEVSMEKSINISTSQYFSFCKDGLPVHSPVYSPVGSPVYSPLGSPVKQCKLFLFDGDVSGYDENDEVIRNYLIINKIKIIQKWFKLYLFRKGLVMQSQSFEIRNGKYIYYRYYFTTIEEFSDDENRFKIEKREQSGQKSTDGEYFSLSNQYQMKKETHIVDKKSKDIQEIRNSNSEENKSDEYIYTTRKDEKSVNLF
jgi:hypothetical protein